MSKPLLSVSSLISSKVKNDLGGDLGNIKDLMLNIHTGEIAYAILAFGGFLGLGSKYFAVPWKAFSFNKKNACLLLEVPQEKLKNAPGFEKANWSMHSSNGYLSKVYKYYGFPMDW